MMAPLPKPATRRRTTQPSYDLLPADGCQRKPPAWPFGTPSKAEATLWADLWARPVAEMWHAQHIAPAVVARYVHGAVLDAASDAPKLGAALHALEADLGLSPASLTRLHLRVEPTVELRAVADPFADAKRKRGYSA